MTIAIVALFSKGTTIIRNIYNWRVKETDRLSAMKNELKKIGAIVKEGKDFLSITPPNNFKLAQINTYDDHQSLKEIKTRPGSIIRGFIVSIEKDIILVDAGLKSESAIPLEQFKNSQGLIDVKVGEYVDVALDAIEDGFGETLLSQKDMRHVDIRPIRETIHLEGKELEFKVIKLDQKRNNVVVSRRAVIESENSAERNQLLSNLQEGIKIKGIVKNLTDYGAFVDLGGVDGLLHITDMAWKRVKHPSEIVNVGDEINVKILKFDKEKTRVSLGLKQLGEDPWIAISKRYPEGIKLSGRVTNLTDYGCFVEIEEGVEGLVHVSEMDWTNKN
nr:3-phosphoshikimate 1-carboxyvinyltransferase 2 [Tanacetum cinerariifolium]